MSKSVDTIVGSRREDVEVTRVDQRLKVLPRMSGLYTPMEASRMLTLLECSK